MTQRRRSFNFQSKFCSLYDCLYYDDVIVPKVEWVDSKRYIQCPYCPSFFNDGAYYNHTLECKNVAKKSKVFMGYKIAKNYIECPFSKISDRHLIKHSQFKKHYFECIDRELFSQEEQSCANEIYKKVILKLANQ